MSVVELPTSTLRNVNEEHEASLSMLEQMAVFISTRVGTPGFFLLILVWTGSWVLWNSMAPVELRVDSGLEFAVWIFISNVLQISLMPLLLIAQNLQSRHDEMRAENDFQTTLKSEQELEVILGHLYTLNAKVNAIMDHLEISDAAVRAKDGVPDIVEEEFAKRQQERLDAMALKLAQTHEAALQRSAEASRAMRLPR